MELILLLSLLLPSAAAIFLGLAPRRQALLNAILLAIFAIAAAYARLVQPATIYLWIAFAVSLTIAQFASIFLDRQRRDLRSRIQRLADLAQQREDRIGAIAHDLRNPIAAASGFLDLIGERDLDETQTSGLIDRIGSAVRSLDLQVSNLVDLEQIAAGNLAPHPRSIDPASIVAQVAAAYERTARARGLRLRAECRDVPAVNLDPLYLERMIANLIAFAIARSAEGEVSIQAAAHDGRLRIEVADTGPPLNADQVQRLFAAPAGNARRAADPVGPHIARALAQAAGGELSAESAGERGLHMIAELPLALEKS